MITYSIEIDNYTHETYHTDLHTYRLHTTSWADVLAFADRIVNLDPAVNSVDLKLWGITCNTQSILHTYHATIVAGGGKRSLVVKYCW